MRGISEGVQPDPLQTPLRTKGYSHSVPLPDTVISERFRMEVTLKYGHGTHGTPGPVFRGILGMYVTASDG